MRINTVKKVVEQYGEELVSDLITVMQAEGSTSLYKEVDYSLIEDAKEVAFIINLPKGAYFMSEGRAPGKFPPLQPIKDWAKRHSIPQFRDKKGRFISHDSRAFLIGRKIATKGTKDSAKKFLDKFQIKNSARSEIIKAYKEDVKLSIREAIFKAQ